MRKLKLLWQCFTVWNTPPSANFKDTEVILAHGASETPYRPGRTNEYIAGIIRSLHDQLKIPICAQGEVTQLIRDLPLVGNIPRQCESARYLKTRDVALYQKKVCDQNG